MEQTQQQPMMDVSPEQAMSYIAHVEERWLNAYRTLIFTQQQLAAAQQRVAELEGQLEDIHAVREDAEAEMAG